MTKKFKNSIFLNPQIARDWVNNNNNNKNNDNKIMKKASNEWICELDYSFWYKIINCYLLDITYQWMIYLYEFRAIKNHKNIINFNYFDIFLKPKRNT